MKHMDEGRLQAWLDGPRAGLSEDERTEIEEHLAGCPRCAARVEALRRSGDAVTDLLAAGAGADDEEIPPFDTVVARARDIEPARPRRRWWVITGWAASVMVALGAGWLANEMSRGAGEGETAAERASAAVTDATEPGARERDGGNAVAEDAVVDASGGDEPGEIASARIVAEPGASESTDAIEADAPRRVAVRGQVTDSASGRPLGAAQVSLPGTGVGTLTDPDGRFLLFVDPPADSAGDVTLSVQQIGYGAERRALALADRDTVVTDVRMSPTEVAVEEIVVTGLEEERAAGADAARPAAPAQEEAGRWRAVSRDEAEAFAGFPLRTVPGIEVVSFRAGSLGGVPAVAVEHALEDGGRLTLVQARRPVTFPEEAPGEVVAMRLRDGVHLAARAPLTAASIRSLLERIR